MPLPRRSQPTVQSFPGEGSAPQCFQRSGCGEAALLTQRIKGIEREPTAQPPDPLPKCPGLPWLVSETLPEDPPSRGGVICPRFPDSVLRSKLLDTRASMSCLGVCGAGAQPWHLGFHSRVLHRYLAPPAARQMSRDLCLDCKRKTSA